MQEFTLLSFISLSIIFQIAAYPELFAARTSSDCNAVPNRAYGSHRRPQADRNAKFVITHGGKPRMHIVAGTKYNITLTFPSPRRVLVVANAGSLMFPNKPRSKPEIWYSQAGIRSCPNRLAYGPQTGYAASKSIKFRLLAPKQGASSIALTAVSATSDTSPLLVTRLTLQVHPAKGRLSSSSSSTTSSRPQAVSRHPAGM